MNAAFVLVHSPSVGPSTWTPVAERLAAAGTTAVVPSLLGVADGEPPAWPRVAQAVAAQIALLPPGLPVVLVAHSNAGLFLPVIAQASPRPVAGFVFVDAALPARDGTTPVAPPHFLELLRGKAVDGRLPQWTTWWDEADVAPMFPDAQTRAVVEAEQPRLPLSYYEQRIPAPAGWDGRPCGYLLFDEDAYGEEASEAAGRGWTVDRLTGLHLHQLVDPDGVTERLTAMAGPWL